MPPLSKQDYTRYLNHLASRYGSLEDKTIRRVQSMLKELRGQIAQQVYSLELRPGGEFEAFQLRRLQDNIGRLIDEFNREAARLVNDAISNTTQLGGQAVTGPLKRVGLDVSELEDGAIVIGPGDVTIARVGVGPTATLSPQQAIVSMDYSADLIVAITDPMRSQINKRIRLAIVGAKTPVEMMQEITGVLGVEARANIWGKRKDPVKGIAARAETDLRTELQRAYNLANTAQARRAATLAAKQGVTLLKGWQATGDMRTRLSHLRAHQTYSKNPIPIDQPFILSPTRGSNRGKRFELMYPGDPNGPPELVINCRCTMYTTTDRMGSIGSSLDGRIAKELNRRGT